MRLTIAYSKIKKRNLVLINTATYQRETLSERPIRQPLMFPLLFTSLRRAVKDREELKKQNKTKQKKKQDNIHKILN